MVNIRHTVSKWLARGDIEKDDVEPIIRSLEMLEAMLPPEKIEKACEQYLKSLQRQERMPGHYHKMKRMLEEARKSIRKVM